MYFNRRNRFHSLGKALLHVLVIAVAAAFLLWNAGCSSSPPNRTEHITLDDAVNEASKSPEDQKKLAVKKYKDAEDSETPESEDDGGSLLTTIGMGFLDDDDSAASPEDVTDDGPLLTHYGIVLGGGTINGDETDGFSILGIQIANHFLADRVRAEIHGLFGTTNLHEKSAIAQGLKNEYQLSLGVGGRYYFTPSHTLMGLFALGGFRGGVLIWNYHNAIQTFQAGETVTVTSDQLLFNEVYLGLGTTFWQARRVQMGISFSGGYRYYSDYTFKDFENDLFGSEPFLQLMLEVMLAR